MKARILVYGNVQGVGFRAYVKQVARNMQISGTVKNQPDGSVEIYCKTKEPTIRKFLKKIDIKGSKEDPLSLHTEKIIISFEYEKGFVEPASWPEIFEIDYGMKISPQNKEMIERAEIASLKLENLGSKIGSADSKISSVDSKMTSLNSSLSSVDSKMTSLNSSLSSVDSGMASVNSKLSSVDSKISLVDSNITGLCADTKGLRTETKGNFSKLDKTYGQISKEMKQINKNLAKLITIAILHKRSGF